MTEDDLRDRAVEQAYRQHAPEVYRVAYGILRDADEALDATQDAFARAWERWEQYDSARPLRAWLHGIVVHLALDRLRRSRVRRSLVRPAELLADRDHPTSRSDPAGEAVRRGTVEEALALLRPEARVVLVLRHVYGYDYATIGSFIGAPAGTVGSILTRSHALLRERLAPTDSDAIASRTRGHDPGISRSAPAARPSDHPEVLP